jgi:hypothetical protein
MSLRKMTYECIVESINSGEINLFDINPLMKIGKNLTNFQRFQFSVALIDPSSMSSLGLDIEEKTFSVIKNELVMDLNKRVLKDVFNTRKFEYLDLRPSGSLMYTNVHQTQRRLFDLIMNSKEDYTNIITTGMIASALSDLAEFIPTPNSTETRSGQPYKAGRILDLNVWVDPFMSFNDGRIALFKDIEVDMRNIKSSMIQQATIAPRLLVDYELAFNVGDSKLIFVIDDTTAGTFEKYKSLQRDIKINDILDEK